jgi:hypothetical protein
MILQATSAENPTFYFGNGSFVEIFAIFCANPTTSHFGVAIICFSRLYYSTRVHQSVVLTF